MNVRNFAPLATSGLFRTVSLSLSALLLVVAIGCGGGGGAVSTTKTSSPPPTPLSVTTTSLPNATINISYATTLSASGGQAPYAWTVASGSLPAGLRLNSDGSISGAAATTGSSSFVASVTDALNGKANSTLSLSVISQQLTITSATLPSGQPGIAYSTKLQAANGQPGYAWSLVSGQLPAGLTLSSDGTISGTPTSPGASNFTAKVTDSAGATAQQSLDIVIASNALVISTAATATGEVGVPFSVNLSAAGGTQPYVWTVTNGALPAGLSVSGSQIFGTPTTSGTSTFTVTVTDSQRMTAQLPMTLTIVAALAITSGQTLSAGEVQVAYSKQLQATGGKAAYVWSVASGSLPQGLSLNSSGLISGTPTSAGTANFTVSVRDSLSGSSASSTALAILPSLAIATSSLPGASVSTSYGATLAASGGQVPYSWSQLSGTLPAGLSFSNGVISGTPTASGSATLTFKVTDALGAAQQQSYTLSVTSGITVTTSSLSDAEVAAAYSLSLSATGGAAPYSWSLVSGSLPAGMSLSSAGALTGTPTSAGSYTFAVGATDANKLTAQRSFTIKVVSALSIVTSVLPNGTVSTPYSATLSSSGGSGTITWAIASGSLPSGFQMNSAGTISGQIGNSTSASFTAKATDALGISATRSLSLAIKASGAGAPVISTTRIPGAVVSQSYSSFVKASGGTAPITWTIAGDGVSGIVIDSTSGEISGTPSKSGMYRLTIVATDASNATTSADFTFVASAQTGAGNTGDPYADENGIDPAAASLTACGSLTSGKSYILRNNVSAGLGAVCFKLTGSDTKLDLGGFSVTGRIVGKSIDVNGTVIFNGSVTCDFADTTTDFGCIQLNDGSAVAQRQVRIHHVTLRQQSATSSSAARGMHIDWNLGSMAKNSLPDWVPAVRVSNVDSSVGNSSGSRTPNLNVQGGGITVEYANNVAACQANSNACQGMVCYGTHRCRMHGSSLTMMSAPTVNETARALLFDGGNSDSSDLGEAWDNTVVVNQARAVRVRDSINIWVHDNTFLAVNNATTSQGTQQSYVGAIHLGDPDSGTNDLLKTYVYSNSFELGDSARVVFVRNAINGIVTGNTFTCPGTCNAEFGDVRSPLTSGDKTVISLFNNPTASLLGTTQTTVESGAQVKLCNSGSAKGSGTSTAVATPCPAPDLQ